MACPDALLLEVFLVIFLGTEEFRCGNNLRHDRVFEHAGFVERRDRLASLRFLFGIMEENRGAILRAVIRALPVELRGIVALE